MWRRESEVWRSNGARSHTTQPTLDGNSTVSGNGVYVRPGSSHVATVQTTKPYHWREKQRYEVRCT